MYYSQLVKTACTILFQAHKDDLDKGGYPYVFHPFYLATQMDDEASTCAALLHDVIEDHGDMYSFADLERAGFPAPVLDALRLLTHAEGVPYMDYVQALAKNPIARRVKCADLRHNLDTRRIDGAAPAKGHLSAGAGLFGKRNNKKPVTVTVTGFFRLLTRMRTGDLILTKDSLYRLSYSSIQSPRSFRSAGGDREGT